MKNHVPTSHPTQAGWRRVPSGAAGWPRLLLPALLLGLGLLTAPVRAQQFSWAAKTTNTSGKTAVTHDIQGNVYVLSGFTLTVSVGPYTFTSRGAGDILLVKYNAAGVVKWARQIGGKGDDLPGDVDLAGPIGDYLFITGSFRGTATVGSAAGTELSVTSAGQSDVLVAKYTLAGTLHWAKRAGGAGDDYGNSLDATGDQDVYLTGSFTEAMKVDHFLTTTTLTSSGQSDIFLLKCNKDGAFVRARRLGGVGYDYGAAVALDANSGDVYLTGGASPATNPYVTDAFVASFYSDGSLQMQRTYGTPNAVDAGSDVVIDKLGAYVTGVFAGSVSFDSHTLTSGGNSDAFLVLYPRMGLPKVTWAKRFGGTGWDEGQSLAYRYGELYLGGAFTATATIGNTTLKAKGGAADRDLFLACLSDAGTPAWTQQVGSPGYDYGRGGLSLFRDNVVYFTGHLGAATALGSTSLGGAGNLLAKITLPTIEHFVTIDAAADADAGKLGVPSVINYLTLGTNQVNIRASVITGTVGSVEFKFDGVTRIDNTPPFTWAGDEAKPGGGTDYTAFTPALGKHSVYATPYAGSNGTGAKGTTKSMLLEVIDQPVLHDLTLVNAATDTDLQPLTGGKVLNYATLGTNQLSVRANTNTAGSVKFVLDGVARVENAAPFTLAGDVLTASGTDYKPVTLAPGTHRLIVTAYRDDNAAGTASNVIDVTFSVQTGGARLAVQPEASAPLSAFRVAPNPFARRTTLAFTAGEDGPAVVEVCNAQGLPVARLFEGALQKGQAYGWEFDGSTHPAGLYIARLKLGHRVLHQRLVLSK